MSDPQPSTSGDTRSQDSLLDRFAQKLNQPIILHCRKLRDPQVTTDEIGCRVREVGADFVRFDQMRFLESGQISLHISEIIGFQ